MRLKAAPPASSSDAVSATPALAPASVPSPTTPAPGLSSILAWSSLAVALAVIGFALLPSIPTWQPLPEIPSNGSRFPESKLAWQKHAIDPASNPASWITNVVLDDLDQDGRTDLLTCDARWNRVICDYGQGTDESGVVQWKRVILGEQLIAPAHATVVDLNADGRKDVLVSELGNIWPDDEVIGKVTLLLANETGFERRLLLDDVRRVADVQPGDFDGDGDLDLAVAVFGYARGEVLWLEQFAPLQFQSHRLFTAPGAIHVPVADYDADGDLDIVTVISQDDEEVWAFENQGAGRFTPRRLFESWNDDLGSAGLVLSDLDRDGDPDLLLPVGDNLEDMHSYPQPYHGCFWLENQGGWTFAPKRIASFGGTYAAASGDLDGDGDIDVVLASMFNDWDRPGHASLVWLENDGRQQFTPWQIDTQPQHLVTATCGDVNGDGRADVVAGMMRLISQTEAQSAVHVWQTPLRTSP
jgi:ketosteroid isomerase-like protein